MQKSFAFYFQAEDGIRGSSVTGVQTLLICKTHRTRRKISFW